jgi:hypothetical protein
VNASLEHYRNQLREILPALRARFGVTELGLFGSRLRGDERQDSDLDVLVEFAPNARVSLFTLSELEESLENALGLKVDLALKDSLKPHIGRRILAEVQYV